MKDLIVSAAKMELAQLNRQHALHVVAATGFLSKNLLLLDTGLQPSGQMISAVCTLALRNLNNFAPIAALPVCDIQQAILPYSSSPLLMESELDANLTVATTAANVSRHINGLCISPCSKYKEQETTNRLALQITAFDSLHQQDALAAETAMRLDNEPTVEPKLLENIIKNQVQKELKKVLSRHAHQQLYLNGARGAVNNDTFTRASLKKKTTQGNNNNQKAAAAAVVTVTGRQKTPTAAKPTPTHRKNQRTAATDPRPAASARDSADANKTSHKRRSSRKSE
jgi:hypothetical protein